MADALYAHDKVTKIMKENLAREGKVAYTLQLTAGSRIHNTSNVS